MCNHHNYASICIYLHKRHHLKTKVLSPLPWQRWGSWTVPPVIAFYLPDRPFHTLHLLCCYLLCPSLVPLAQHSICGPSSPLQPSSDPLLPTCLCVAVFLDQFSAFPSSTGMNCLCTSAQTHLPVPLHRSSSLLFVCRWGEDILDLKHLIYG